MTRWLDPKFLLLRAKVAYRRGHFSNFNEQELILGHARRLGIWDDSRTFVDIGAGDGIRKSNTFGLVESGWSGIGIEADDDRAASLAANYEYYPDVTAIHSTVTCSNVAELLERHAIPRDLGVLSLDIDGMDYWLLDTILEKYRPRLIISEINEKIPPPIKFVVKYRDEFQMGHHFYGYSIAKLEELLEKHRYSLLRLEYNNVFLAPAELAGPGVTPETAYREGYAARADRRTKFPDNENLEALQTMPPEDGIALLNDFYSRYKGEYEIGL